MGDYITSRVLIFSVKKKMKFRVCCCLFDYYVYTISTKSIFSFSHGIYKEKDIGYTFTFCAVDCFIHVCYTCIFTSIKTKRINKDLLNETLRPHCHGWLSDSHISRVQKTEIYVIYVVYVIYEIYVVPVVVGALGRGIKALTKGRFEEGNNKLLDEVAAMMEKAVLMDSESIVRRVISGLIQGEDNEQFILIFNRLTLVKIFRNLFTYTSYS